MVLEGTNSELELSRQQVQNLLDKIMHVKQDCELREAEVVVYAAQKLELAESHACLKSKLKKERTALKRLQVKLSKMVRAPYGSQVRAQKDIHSLSKSGGLAKA